jgi:hypothetical protein
MRRIGGEFQEGETAAVEIFPVLGETAAWACGFVGNALALSTYPQAGARPAHANG